MLEIDKEKFENILAVYRRFYTILAGSVTDLQKSGSQVAASNLTLIYFQKEINYIRLQDAIRNGIEESKPLFGHEGPL